MRTTLINTTFWREGDVDYLHLDSKLLYLFMLTNPDKGLANIYHFKPKVISAYCGLSVDQISVAINQLKELGYVDVFEGFYILLKGHEMPKKGRFTKQTIEKDKELVPEKVLEHFNLLEIDNSSGVAPEHNNNNKDNTNTINNTKEITTNKSNIDINEMFEAWNEIVGYEISANKQKNRYACSNLLKKYGKDKLTQLLNGVLLAQSDKFAPRISDFATLQSKLNELLLWGKRKGTKQNKGIIRI